MKSDVKSKRKEGEPFRPGDVVIARSGKSRPMTVERHEGGTVRCAWQDADGKVHRENWSACDLEVHDE